MQNYLKFQMDIFRISILGQDPMVSPSVGQETSGFMPPELLLALGEEWALM